MIFLAISYLPVGTPPSEKRSGPVYVIDGDTVAMNKARIRLKGIDAPEMKQSCERNGSSYACGVDSRNALREKIGKSTIACQTEGRDRYDRDLAYCYLGETDLNGWMVKQGWALAYGGYRREEADARSNRRGVWAGRFENPGSWRKGHPNPYQETLPPQQRDIIGNFYRDIKNRFAIFMDRFRS